jgi:hypothetical protein
MKKIVLVVVLLVLIANFAYRIDLKKSPHELVGELMYFPSGAALRALSMGFYAAVADLVWLRFIQYYGEHRMTDTRFEYLFHILDILTTLDIHFIHAYTLGALMLTHDAQSPEQARRLLKKGMRADPDAWTYPFIYGFIHYLFLKDYVVAQTYFRISAQKPRAPDMPKRWAAYTVYKKIDDLAAALALWLDLYNSSENPEEKALAKYYAEKIKMQMDIKYLDEKVTEFIKRTGNRPVHIQELVVWGIVDSLPNEPHGETYYIKQGKVYSTWKQFAE